VAYPFLGKENLCRIGARQLVVERGGGKGGDILPS
jgi:hypothetical protein